MKKTDILIALALGVLISAFAIWFAQPKWYNDLAEGFREWREPRRPSMNRYIDRDRMRREEREDDARNENDRGRGETQTRYSEDANAPRLSFAVVDAITNKPVTAFRYRRYFEAKRPGDPPQEISWNTVSNDLGTFELAAERTYEPAKPPRSKTVAQTELWKNAIEDEMQKRWAQSDTLEINAEGYGVASIRLFDLVNADTPDPARQEIRLIRRNGLKALAPSQTSEGAAEPEGLRTLLNTPKVTAMEQLRQLRAAAGKPSQPVKDEGSLYGAISLSGEPPYNGLVSVFSSGASTYEEAQLSPNGTYTFERLSPGACVVTIRATLDGENWREHRESITLGKGEAIQLNYDFPSFGILVGTVTGLYEGESGGIFAIKGDYALSNVTEDDLYDLGEICEGEARPNKEGVFTIRELEEGKYTIVAIAERLRAGEDRSFLYVSDTVEIKAGEEANIALSLK